MLVRREDRRGLHPTTQGKSLFRCKDEMAPERGTNLLGEDETTHFTLTYEILAKGADAQAPSGPTPRRLP
jgi:hypothetical protein